MTSSVGQLYCATGRHSLRCFLAEVFSCMAGSAWSKAHSSHYAAGPSRCRWLAELHAVSKESGHLYTSGSLIATVYLSRFLKLKICGKKHSVCSIVGSQVQFQPAVGLGAWTRTRWIRQLCLNLNHKVWSWSLNTMQKSMRDLLSYGAPIMLLRFLRKTGREYHSTQANPKSLLFASTGRSWWLNIGSGSPQWFQMGEMTGTWHHRSARLGSKRGWRSRLSVDMLWILPWIGPLPGH